MKREIKFRGKCLDNGEWVYGYYVKYNDYSDNIHESIIDEYGYMYEVDLATVGQYTGLKDKNGKEIWEGDIVKWDDCSNGRYWRFAGVEYAPDIQFNCAMIPCFNGVRNSHAHTFEFGRFAYKNTHKYLEVIGNIHDHPELINKADI